MSKLEIVIKITQKLNELPENIRNDFKSTMIGFYMSSIISSSNSEMSLYKSYMSMTNSDQIREQRNVMFAYVLKVLDNPDLESILTKISEWKFDSPKQKRKYPGMAGMFNPEEFGQLFMPREENDPRDFEELSD